MILKLMEKFSVALVCSVFLFVIGSAPSFAQKRINEALECSWLEYDFGNVSRGEMIDCVLSLKNVTESSIIVKHVITSCNCISASAEKRVIGVNETISIRIEFRTAEKKPGECVQSVTVITSDDRIYSFVLRAIIFEERLYL